MFPILAGAVLPLLITPGLFFHYDTTPKTLLLEWLAVWCLMNPSPRLRALSMTKHGRLMIALAGSLVIWFGIVTALSSRPWFSLLGSTWRQFGFVTVVAFAAVSLCIDAKSKSDWLRCTTVAGLVMSAYIVLQYFDIDPLQSAAAYRDHAGDSIIVRPPGTMGHADFVGWWLAVSTFCSLALARESRGVWRIIGWAATAVQPAAIVFTGTRSALLALAAGFLFSGARLRWRYAAVATAAVAALFLSPIGARLRARVQWSAEEPAGGARPLLWRDSAFMAMQRPVFGYGLETFSGEFLRFQSEELANVYPDTHQESPHNLPLDAAVSAGLPGMLLAVCWFALPFRLRRSPLVGAVAASAVASLFTAAMVGPLLLTTIAIVLACTEEIETRALALSGVAVWLARGVGLAILIHSVWFAWDDYRLARFRDSPNAIALESLQRYRLAGAADDISCSRLLGNSCAKEGSAPKRLQCQAMALRTAAMATQTADDPANAWYNLAIFTASQEDLSGTERALRRAIEIAPHWFKPHWTLARLLQVRRRRDEAIAEAKLAARLANNRYPEVRYTLDELERQ